jgi:hypothetical protein
MVKKRTTRKHKRAPVKKSRRAIADNLTTIELATARRQADAAINALVQISFDANTALVGVREMLIHEKTIYLGSIPFDFRNLCDKLFKMTSEINGMAHVLLRDLKTKIV